MTIVHTDDNRITIRFAVWNGGNIIENNSISWFTAVQDLEWIFKLTITNTDWKVQLPLASKEGENFLWWYLDNERFWGSWEIKEITESLELSARYWTAVAVIWNTEYDSLTWAIAAANNGDIISIVSDIELKNWVDISKNLTLDLNWKTISADSDSFTTDYVFAVKRWWELSIDWEWTIDGSNIMVWIKLTVLWEERDGDSYTAKKAKLIINNWTIKWKEFWISWNWTRHNTELTINGWVIKCVNEDSCTAIYIPQDWTTSINGGEIEWLDAALEIRAWNLTINWWSFFANKQSYSCVWNWNGTTTAWAAIGIAQHTTI